MFLYMFCELSSPGNLEHHQKYAARTLTHSRLSQRLESATNLSVQNRDLGPSLHFLSFLFNVAWSMQMCPSESMALNCAPKCKERGKAMMQEGLLKEASSLSCIKDRGKDQACKLKFKLRELISCFCCIQTSQAVLETDSRVSNGT